MNKIMLLLASVLVIFGSVGIAAAEPSLDEILEDAYGSGNYQIAEAPNDDYLLDPASYGTVTVYANITADQGGWADPTGWYVPGASPVLHPLFAAPSTGDSGSFTTDETFGMYIKPNDDTTIYSQNTKNSRKLVKLYIIDKDKNGEYDDSCFVFAFEDTIIGGDNDYQDVVVEVCSDDGLNLIPEFPTVALPVAAILGLVFVFGRKKEGL